MKAKGKNRRSNAYVATYNRAANITHNKSEKRYNFGLNNLLPNELLAAVSASVTAASCRIRKQEFIEGKGLQDKGIASMVINPNQTADDLVAELADYAGLFNCPSVNVKYNALGEPRYVYAMPFDTVRKTDDGRFYANEKLREGKDTPKDRIYYDEFDRKESPQSRLKRVSEQIEEYGYQTGDIVYLFAKKAGQKEYPVPVAWAGMEEIESDIALAKLDYRNVKKGFRPDVILTTVGDIDGETEDENGQTDQDKFDNNVKKFTGEDAASILHLQVDSLDQLPKVDAFDAKALLSATTEAEDRIGRRVCRAMEVPEVLIAGFSKAGQLGNVQEMITILKLFSLSISKYQRLITRTLEKVMPQLDWTIEPLVLIEELPQWLLDNLTADEKRALGGYEPLEKEVIE